MPFIFAFITLFAVFLISCTSLEKNSSQESHFDSGFVPLTIEGGQRRPTNDEFDFKADIENVQINTTKEKIAAKVTSPELILAKSRMDKLFEHARKNPKDFFAFMRKYNPIFELKGAAAGEKKIPNIYLITRHKDVLEVLNKNETFSVKPYRDIMDKTVGNEFMLAYEGTVYNQEKPAMHSIVDGKTNEQKVREIVAQLTRRAIQKGMDGGYIDVVKNVTRAVPIGLNEEYFGFYGPNPEALYRWSRATQHAFFHNPTRNDEINQRSIRAGVEMREHIKNTLLPNKKMEIANGRPANDVVAQLIQLGQTHHRFDKEERVVANTIGLLVGSVETTSAAIAQSLNVILQNQKVRELAVKAAQENNNDLLSRIVWEALRFDPINPWVGRFAEKEAIIARGTPYETKIPAGSLVLASSESAMQDEQAFPEPFKFNINRDPNSYMHIGYGYHRCLGDDVALVMVPEVIKHLLLLDGLRIKTALGSAEPFPESFILEYNTTNRKLTKDKSDFEKSVDVYMSIKNEFSLPENASSLNDLKNLFAKNRVPQARVTSRQNIEAQIVKDLEKVNTTSTQKYERCESNKLNQEMFSDPKDLSSYCGANEAFRACLTINTRVHKQSNHMAYYRCSYGKNLLSQAERTDFKNKMASTNAFYFLKFEGER